MFFDKLRRRAGVAGLVTAMAVAMPALPASAALGGQPTPLTITPDFANRVAAKPAPDRAGEVQVAQTSGEITRLRRLQQENRREVRRDTQRVRREVRRNVRQDVRRDARQEARREVRSDIRRAERRADQRQFRREVRRDRRDIRSERYDRRHNYRGRWYYGYGDDWYDDSGAWVAAGVIGLAAGAIVGSAFANPGYNYGNTVVVTGYATPYSAAWYRQCDLKYRSFRASDGTFLGYDGLRHLCRLP